MNNFKPGDLITTYYKGYYTFVESEDRGKGFNPLIKFQIFADSKGNLRKPKEIWICDASFCKLASEKIKDEIEKKKQEIIKLEKILETINGKI